MITKATKPKKQLPDFDVLVAGFPCQPFSIAGVSKKNALGRPHGVDRPYRAAVPIPATLATMAGMVGTAIDPLCFEALRQVIGSDSAA